MSANHITVRELRATFDEKLAPLKVVIAELTSFFENGNQKYDQVLKKLTEQEKECKEEIKKENKFLKSTVRFSEQETDVLILVIILYFVTSILLFALLTVIRASVLCVYRYFEKGCRKKCARDNPER